MLIRSLLLASLGAIGFFVFFRRNRLPVHIFTVFLLLGLAAVAVLDPALTSEVAELMGVGRGTDLVTYITITVVVFVLVHYYTKFIELQEKLTALMRELEILRGELDDRPADGSER